MNEPKQTTPQPEPSNGQSDKTKSFLESLEAARQETIRKGFHANSGAGVLVPRSSLNYQEGRASSTPVGEASPWSDHVTRILPPKEDFKKLLENPTLISDEAWEIERELAMELGLD